MTKEKLIISSCDSKYFHLLKELFLSIKKTNLFNEYDFAVLDTGMDLNQLNYLKDNKVIIAKARWDVKVPQYKILGRNHLKTQTARAFLPDYFPNFKIYIWLDADLWLNDVNSFLLYEKGAFKNSLAITPQVDRAYYKLASVEWFFNFPKRIKTINYKNIGKSVSKKLAKKYAFHATLNAGAFAIKSNSLIWDVFQKNVKLASKKGRIFGTDQVALALSVYEDKIPTEFLPSYCNWMCEFNLPFFDENKKMFIEPYLPHNPIALIHLAGLDEIRSNKDMLSSIKTLNGNVIKRSLRFNV